jgi:phosphoesterase RecJ-like protein
MVNLAAGIEEIKIWLNFTYDIEKDIILGEFRSRGIKIVDIAKKYGGGGHEQACGASLKSWTEVDQVISDYKALLKENK